MIASQLLAASVLVALVLPAAGAAARSSNASAAAQASRAAPAASDSAPTRRTPFTHFGADAAIELRGDAASASFEFGNRGDELVTRATLHLRYRYSPELAPDASAIRVAVNDEEVGTLAVDAKQAGELIARSIDVDPRLIVGTNKLTLTLAAAPGGTASEDARPGLWAEVSGGSELEIAYRPLVVADDLAILPEPFFDRRDQRRVSVPFVFNAQPSIATLNAAAVVASWLGQLAEWRGTRFPASLETPPRSHAIAFVANDERPAFLASVPPAAGPELRIMTSPADGRSKLLLVMGRDAAQLKAAADALVLGGAKLSGATAKLGAVAKPVRVPYDAPTMVRLDRPVKLAERVEWPKQLEATGRPPALPTVGVDLRVPPDLATWRGPGVPMALQVRYNPGACTSEAELETAIDGDPLVVTPLRAGTNEVITEQRELHVPAWRLRTRMRLEFTFRFTPRADPACLRAPPAIKAAVSPESTLDFSGFPHFAQMPNLNHFASMGYPFTRLADLSQTVVVLPERPVAADVEAMLGLMGRMGEATGYPATRVRLATPRDEAQLADADLLVIGATPQQSLLVKWAARLPVRVTGYAQRAARAEPTRLAAVRSWLGLGTQDDLPPASPVSFDGGGPIASVFGFESPVTPGRSVVAVTAVAPEQVLRVLDALEDGDQRKAMRGNAAFVLPGKVESALVGETYDVGFMPPWTGLSYWLRENPVVLGALVLIGGLLLTAAAWLLHWRLSAWRARGRG
jgi:hypothetical protein